VSLVGFQARNHPQQAAKSFVDDRETDPALFAQLHERFRFTIDVAASPHNAKLPRYYTAEDDGLEQSWAGERVWCNPPYSDIAPWVRKAWTTWGERWRLEDSLTVMLVPANRTEQGWWQDNVELCRDRPGPGLRVEFLRGRTRFIAAGDTEVKPNARPPFGCCLLIWGSERDA
jgi:phage N-6-adenine-methyltransferase